MQKITPFLWFGNNAEEAINFYKSIFKDAEVTDINRYGPNMPMPEGTLLTASFKLLGQEFIALNSPTQFKFNESVSFSICCKDQEEVDYYWDVLIADGGHELMCGWLKDKFGLTWQVVPENLGKLLHGDSKERSAKAVAAMMKMKKLDINVLQQAYDSL